MAMIPADQATDWTTTPVVAPPMDSARTASMVGDSGWWSANVANAWSHPGMDATGTTADEAGTSANDRGAGLEALMAALSKLC